MLSNLLQYHVAAGIIPQKRASVPMITTTAFREGLLFEYEGDIYELITYQHHRMSQSKATVRAKMRNLNTGAVIERGFPSGEKFREVEVQKRAKSYMYTENGMAHFMDLQDYEQVAFPIEKLGESAHFLVENMEVEGMYFDGKLFSVHLPASVIMTVSSTVPGVKGDSVSNMTKPATLESGFEIKVPLFIKEGEKIRVDTRTGEYIERA